MWARICEIALAVWLIASHWVLSEGSLHGFSASLLILLFALLSFREKLNKMHLLQVIPAGWLLFIAYSYPTPWLPPYLQNYIAVGLTLLIFAIIPSNASDHPRPWKEFLAKRGHSKE